MICALGLVILYFLPFLYTVQVVNEHNNTINATISAYWHGHKVSSRYGSRANFVLPSGQFEIRIDPYGYSPQNLSSKNRLFNYTGHIRQPVVMHPKEIALAKFEYLDPTGTVRLSPKFMIEGTTIQGDAIKKEYDIAPVIQFGSYSIYISTEYFDSELGFEGEDFAGNLSTVFLEPNNMTLAISQKEMGYVENFFDDYINLSMAKEIDAGFRGYPKQYYLYQKKAVLSLGDIFLLFCEKEAYKKSGRQEALFILLDKQYSLDGTMPCYASMLEGRVPDGVGDNVYGSPVPFEIDELNRRNHRIAIAFSYDIESGRYLNNGNKKEGLGPCADPAYDLGLDMSDIDCDDADFIAWFTPLSGDAGFDDYPYPWVSGISGFKDILSISSRYGIPSTYYIVAREIDAYNELAPEVVQETKELVKKGLVEIGTHTYYHTRLGVKSVEFDKEQIMRSKTFLEEEFDTPVVGIRGPYFSLIGNDVSTNARSLHELGFYYSSNEDTSYRFREGESANKAVNVYIISNAPDSLLTKLPIWYRYVITIDHPWNIYYSEVTKGGKTYLQENDTIHDHYRAMVLSAISEGYIPYLVKDIEVPDVGQG